MGGNGKNRIKKCFIITSTSLSYTEGAPDESLLIGAMKSHMVVVVIGLLLMAYVAAAGIYMDDDDDFYLRLQHGKEFHNLVYMSYVKHIMDRSL
jgi:hypothetical protein